MICGTEFTIGIRNFSQGSSTNGIVRFDNVIQRQLRHETGSVSLMLSDE